MKALLGILVVVVLVAIVAISLGYVNVDQTQQAKLPSLEGGQLPKVAVQGPSVEVGTRNETVEVPTVEVKKGGEK